jgi:hypothetical protein
MIGLSRRAAIIPGFVEVVIDFDRLRLVVDRAAEIPQSEPLHATIVIELGATRIEFDGAVEISQPALMVTFAVARQTAIVPNDGETGIQFDYFAEVADSDRMARDRCMR